MRVTAFSFIPHLFAAMILFVDVLVSLPTKTQTLHSNKRNATDHQLRAQDSHAKIIVIVPTTPPTRLTSIPPELQLHLQVRDQQGTSTSAGPSQLLNDEKLQLHKWHYDYVALMDNALRRTDSATTDRICLDFISAWNSIHLKSNLFLYPSKINEMNPYYRLILSIALYLKQTYERGVINETDWNSILDHLIYFGFHRNEVQALLLTAKCFDVEHCMASYDQSRLQCRQKAF
ncbi:hypothetical protein Plhal710r2_c032g0118311 [Plasmopara halstedii]